MFFTEFEGYVDGGVLANNPCDYGLTAIRDFHREKRVKLPISMVVSIGTGVYPPEEIGNTNAQEFLFFGRHWFNVNDTLKKRTQNLISLLTNAVSLIMGIKMLVTESINLYTLLDSELSKQEVSMQNKWLRNRRGSPSPTLPQYLGSTAHFNKGGFSR